MLQLSIIIPCLQTDEPFDETLASVLQNCPQHSEVLAVHRGVYDDPYDLNDEVRFVQQPTEASLVDLVNTGVAAASAEVVLVVACGLQVAEGWTDSALPHFDNPCLGSVSPLVGDHDNIEKPWISGISLSRAGRRRLATLQSESVAGRSSIKKTNVLGPTLAAAFFRKAALEKVGGLAAIVGDEMADVDLALSLAAAGYETIIDTESRFSGHPVSVPGESSFRKGQFAERLYFRQIHAGGLAGALLVHPWSNAAELVGGLLGPSAWARFVGRLAVCREIPTHLEHRDRLTDSSPATQPAKSSRMRVDAAHGDPQWSQRNANKPAS